MPKMRATISTIATARKNAAMSLLNDVRCLTAANFSPAGESPEGVVRTGLASVAVAGIGVAGKRANEELQ